MNMTKRLWLLLVTILMTNLLWGQQENGGLEALTTLDREFDIQEKHVVSGRTLLAEQLFNFLDPIERASLGLESLGKTSNEGLKPWVENLLINQGLGSYFKEQGAEFLRFETGEDHGAVIEHAVLSSDDSLTFSLNRSELVQMWLDHLQSEGGNQKSLDRMAQSLTGLALKVSVVGSLNAHDPVQLFVSNHLRLSTTEALQQIRYLEKGLVAPVTSEALVGLPNLKNSTDALNLTLRAAKGEVEVKVSVVGVFVNQKSYQNKGLTEQSTSQFVNGLFSQGGTGWTWSWTQNNVAFNSPRIDNVMGNPAPSAFLGGGNAFSIPPARDCYNGTVSFSSFQQAVDIIGDVTLNFSRKYEHVNSNIQQASQGMQFRIYMDDLTTFQTNILIYNEVSGNDRNWQAISREVRNRNGHRLNFRFEGTLFGNYPCSRSFTGDLGHKTFIDNVHLLGIIPVRVELYRLYKFDANNPGLRDHLYTANLAERNSLIQSGWTDEGISGYVHQTQVPSSVALYRLYSYDPVTQRSDHFYTVSASTRDFAIQIGYTYQGITGYLSSTHVANTNPFYRLYHPTVHDHFYTDSQADRLAAIAIGYTDEGNEGFIWNVP